MVTNKQMTTRDRLVSKAKEKWGDEWFLEMIEHADGDRHYRVHHTKEHVADGVVIRDVLRMGTEDILRESWLIKNREYIAGVDGKADKDSLTW